MSDSLPTLASLEIIAYINAAGELPDQFQGKVGVYAIFDQDQGLQFIGYSRDIYLSLQQHLVRQPDACYWVKAQTIDRPNRTILEEIRNHWIAETGSTPEGNTEGNTQWTQAIEVKPHMTPEELVALKKADDIEQGKLLKQAARRIEEQILAKLRDRGLATPLRFNPKLKEVGLLDLK